MRRPQSVGRVTGTDSRAFLYMYSCTYLYFMNHPVRESAGILIILHMLELLISNAGNANNLYHVNKNEAHPYLSMVWELTFKQPELLSEVSNKDAAVLGETYLNLLDAVNDERVFQTLATLGYYFLSCGLQYNPQNSRALCKIILILNLGAQTFCRTIATAKNLLLPTHIDFSNWQHLPKPVKMVLLLEYAYSQRFKRLVILPDDMAMRIQWLEGVTQQGYFNDLCPLHEIIEYADNLHSEIMLFLKRKIVMEKHLVFND
jgi:uncharacterized protein (DUF983 family)